MKQTIYADDIARALARVWFNTEQDETTFPVLREMDDQFINLIMRKGHSWQDFEKEISEAMKEIAKSKAAE